MSIVTITLSNRDFKLYCPEESHAELYSLAAKLDNEINKVKQANPSASFELLLVMVALNLLDNKQKQTNLEAEDIAKETNEDFQVLLSSIFNELKVVAEKFTLSIEVSKLPVPPPTFKVILPLPWPHAGLAKVGLIVIAGG